MAVVCVNDLAHDREPEARALRLGRKERTENALEVVGRDPRAAVPNLDHNLRWQRVALTRWLFLSRYERRSDVHVAFTAQRLERIREQVREELAQLMGVGQKLRHVRG